MANYKLLKDAAICGANVSGKSNVYEYSYYMAYSFKFYRDGISRKWQEYLQQIETIWRCGKNG